MTTKPHNHESRYSALSRIQAGLERLEQHMITLVQENANTRQMLQEERQAQAAQFQEVEHLYHQAGGPY